MDKVTVAVNKGFPFWYEQDGVYLTAEPREVSTSAWLDTQIQAGLVSVHEAEAQMASDDKPSKKRSRAKAEA